MNIAEDFADYLETITGSTLGQDLFIGEAPSSNKVGDNIFWIVTSGGVKTLKAQTGEAIKAYTIDVYYRSTNYQGVYNVMQALEEELNCAGCVQIGSYDTIEVEAITFPIDTDLDDEERKVGLLQANLTIYKDCPGNIS